MAPEGSPLHRLVEPLAAHFVGDVTVADALRTICDAAIEATPPAEQASIATTIDARVGTYVVTHPDVEKIDQVQYLTSDGPCIDIFRTGQPVVIASMVGDGPYAVFRRASADHGFHSVVALPLNARAQIVGALTLYAREPGAFSPATAAGLQTFATRAAYVILNHQAYWDARSLSENLEQAMASRAVIEQAKGIIMATNGCTPDEAFEQLRQQSQHENVKVREIAAEIVRRTQRR